MRQQAIYKIRLLLMAEYLENIKEEPKPEVRELLLEWPLHYLDVFYHMKYNARFFDCLTRIFSDHWEFGEFQEPQLKSLPGYGLSRGFIFFFGLKTPEELIHLFDCQAGTGQNIERWGGTELISTSSSFDVAYNIREYVARKD